MERNKKKYGGKELKRNSYGENFRNKMRRIEQNDDDSNKSEILNNIKEIKNLPLTLKIKDLNQDIQKKIYFITIKNYWKRVTLETVYRPFWYSYNEYLNREIQKVYFENIHFLHLEFNTLPGNKKWIMGCQCSFCKEEDNKHNIFYVSRKYFINEILLLRECEDYDINYWNMDEINGFRIYNYLYNSCSIGDTM